MIMLRSKAPIKITAGYFFALSVETYMKVSIVAELKLQLL